MNRRQADAVVGGLVAAVLVVGGILAWQATRSPTGGRMMDSMMGTSTTGTGPLPFAVGTLLLAAIVGGVYLAVRDDLTGTDDEGSATGTGATADPATADAPEPDGKAVDPTARPRPEVLDLLPEDERRILEPVLTSPGLTQIELRDRSEFSKSKVSQTVSGLEKRGLIYREPQGRTYRVYPSDELDENGD